jgi:hypothetical protein
MGDVGDAALAVRGVSGMRLDNRDIRVEVFSLY